MKRAKGGEVGESFEDFEGVADVARKDEVADDDAAVGGAVLVKFQSCAYLPNHFAYGSLRHFRVVGRVAAEAGEGGVHVFEVGKVDVDQSLKAAEGVDALVARRVVDNGGGGSVPVYGIENVGNAVCVMGGCDESQE